MEDDKKTTLLQIAVKPEVKREIDIIAATEQRYTYEAPSYPRATHADVHSRYPIVQSPNIV